ncbi:MAG: PQQ-dependent sugar dehydrogenase [Planctomycetota bacterium]
MTFLRRDLSIRRDLQGEAGIRRRVPLGALLLAVTLGWATPGSAQIPMGDLTIVLEPVADGLSSPVLVTHAGDGSGRLFVVDQTGQIRIVQDGALLATPFLDITERMVELSEVFDERGLLGLAFHPDYANNGRFFVRYSAPREGDPAEPCNDPMGFIVGCHFAVLAEFSVSEGDPNLADPDSEMILFQVDEPQFNHNGGDLAFGPDGHLYFALGDGGGAHDGLADMPPSHGPIGNGQNIETHLGSMLRIDVDGAPPFEVPPDNPFVGKAGLDEIFAYGFRNPFRFSFDSLTDILYVADVGQALFEEVSIVENGGNYGWVIREGAHCFDPFNPGEPPDMCPTDGLTDPVAEYTHVDGIAIIGGFVYRADKNPELFGKYVFGDFSLDFGPTGRLFYFDADGDPSQIFEFILAPENESLGLFLKGMGQDEEGEIYALVGDEVGPFSNTAQVLRIDIARPFIRGDGNGDGMVDMADPIFNFNYLFEKGPSFCLDAQDSNDDGKVNIADPVYNLNFQFTLGPAPFSPFPGCGLDPTADALSVGELGCQEILLACP